MSRLIDFGKDYGTVSFPDDATDQQIVSEYDSLTKQRAPQAAEIASPTVGDYAKHIAGQLIRGGVGMVAAIPEQLAIGASGLSRLTGGDIPIAGEGNPGNAQERSTYQLGQLIRKTAEDITPPSNPALEKSFWATAVPQGIGSSVGFMAGGLGGRLLKIPEWLSIAGLGAAASGSDFYNDAKAHGADEGTAQLASTIGSVVGTSEALPMARIMHRLDGLTGGSFSKALVEAGKSTFEEALQEGAQQVAQNITARELYDKDRSLFEDVATNAGAGGATGFLMSALASAIGIPIGRSNMRREGTDRRRAVISREVEQGNLLPETGAQNAESTGTIPNATSQEEALGQEGNGGVRLRNLAQNGLEAGSAQVAPTTNELLKPTNLVVPTESEQTNEQVLTTQNQAVPPQGSNQPGGTGPIYRGEEVRKGGVPQETAQGSASPQRLVVQNAINDVTKNWKNAPPVQVVDTSDQFPADVKSAAAQQGIPLNEAPAVFSQDGTVWLAANQINDADHAKRLLLHEAVGHFGVESIFGSPEQFTAFMQGVAERHADTELGRTTRELYGNDPVRVGREVVAKLAENPQADPTLWQRIVATVREWARKVFNLGVSDNDIKVLLSKGRTAVESGQPKGVSAQNTSFAQAPQQDAPVVYRGFQEGVGSIKGFDLYNLTDTIAPNLVKGSTVTESALNKAGFRVPEAEKVKADAARPPGASFAVEHEIFKRAQQEVREERSPTTREVTGYSVRGAPGRFQSREDALAKAIVLELRADKISKPLNRYLDDLIGRTGTDRGMEFQAVDVPRSEFYNENGDRIGEASFAVERPASPQTFQNRQQVEAAISDPLLTPAKRAAAQGLAAVQSSMVSDQIMGNLMATPKDDAEKFAQNKLGYLQDRRFMSDFKEYLNSLPETTEDEKRAKEVAAAVILNHYGTDRNVEREINTELATDQNAMANAVQKITKLNNAQIKANFLTSMFNRLVKDYRTYLDNIGKNLPASGNLQSQYRQRLADAERRLSEQEASPIAVQKALSAIAQKVPDNLLTANSSNDAIISWALTSDVLQGVVGDEVRNWLLADDGSGEGSLRGYGRLIEDLNSLRDVLANQDKLSNDIKAFERWFRPSGKEGKVSVKRFAEAYSKFRASRDRAAKLAAAMEKDIDDLDTRLRGNVKAREWLQTLMTSHDYVSTVREAAKQADVVVRALYEGGQKTGLIERDKTVGLWRMQVPGGTPYVVDLHPSATTEPINQGNLKGFAAEARQYSIDNAITNPLLADEYSRLADYIDRYMVHPALNPNQGFTQLPWIKIPWTNIRMSADPFGWTAKTIRDVLEKIGGRTALQAVRDANELDTVMRKVEGINSNAEYGYAAQTQAVLKAIDSHGWTADQFPQWDERVAERVIAAGQNNLGPSYEVGDVIVGSGGVVLTSEDMAALKMMKKWEDEVLKVAPKHIQDVIGKEGLGITRKAISSGHLTMARTQAPWTEAFLIEWGKATTEAKKLKLLEHDNRFRRIVMGYISEFNPEFQKMNKANPDVTKFYDIFRLMAKYEKSGVQSFTNLDQVLDFMASEMVSRNMAPDQVTARNQAKEALMSDIEGFIKSFRDNVVGRKTEDVWGAVPPAIVSAASARNAFTVPRGNLVAPSTFYTYSRASDGSRAHYVGSLRSLMNLKLLQSSFEMRRALEAEKTRMEERADDLAASGLTKRKAMSEMIKETAASRKASELRFDYLETINALSMLEKAFNELTKFEQSSTEHYQHGGVAALLNVFGTLKASLLSSPQAVTTNFWSGTMLGPALVHLQTGRIARGITDFVLEPHLWSVLYKRLSSMVAGNPTMEKLLNKHAPLWDWMARGIVNAANDWNRLEEIAHQSGMVTPYNLSDMVKNKTALKTTAGRLESEEEILKRGVAATNYLMSSILTRRPIETLKATTPRWFDNMVNYTLIQAFDYETDFLKKMGWVAFQNLENLAARSGTDYRDLSNPDNILQPGDLGLGTWKSLNRYREIFSGMGSLDRVLLDFYERTKSMTPEQRRAEPLIKDISDHAAVALQYAAITNVATETNRPFLFKGKGSEGVWKNVIGTFMGWPINMVKQLSKELQTHSADPKFDSIFSNMIGLATMVTLLALSGAWNWEFGDELTKKLFGQSSARIQIGNVTNAAKEGDYKTGGLYFVQSLVNTVPFLGPQLGSMLGVSYTGRGNMFDLTSMNPVLGWIAATWNTGKRIAQTGDPWLPLADYTKQYVPLSRMVINRLPIMQGLVDQQNAVRSLNGSAPRDVEIKWGRGGGGDIRYSPASDEIMKLISAAYDVTLRGADQSILTQRYNDAINAYVNTGKTPEEAAKLVASALSSKEPIRILTGREMTPEEEQRWIRRMTPEQKEDYDHAVAAWGVLGSITGKNMDMVSDKSGGGGGSSANLSPVTGLRVSGGGGGGLSKNRGLSRRSSLLRRAGKRQEGPRLARRRSLGGRSRLGQSLRR